MRTRAPHALLAGLLLLLATPVRAQNAAPTVEGQMKRMSTFGEKLSDADALALLREMRQMTEQALAASRTAEQAATVPEVKAAAERVHQAVWGQPSGVPASASAGEVRTLGWKEQWQVTGAEFDPNFVKRLGSEAPRVTDPRQLGVVGRGRAVRGHLETITRNSSHVFASREGAAEEVLASINNVIGWTYITTGLKGREQQPRISLTHIWDAPPAFWNSTADTGWMAEAHAQAVNIIKTDYAGDVAEARRHAAGMSELLTRVLNGTDANADGRIEAAPMEGGLVAAVDAASRTTLRAPAAR